MRHRVAQRGGFFALLIVGLGLVGCSTFNSAPTASFTCSSTSGPAPLVIAFDASGSSDGDGSIVSYSWAFGDGGTGVGVSVSHTYTASGHYSAQLTVRDDGGATDGASRSITVTAAPAVVFRVTVDQIVAEFDANEVAAQMKYEGKLTAVSGYIRDFGTYWDGEPILQLNSGPGGSVFDDEVLCYFPVSASASVAQLSKDDYVTVVGRYWMYGLGNVYMRYCYLE